VPGLAPVLVLPSMGTFARLLGAGEARDGESEGHPHEEKRFLLVERDTNTPRWNPRSMPRKSMA
jgi:hypothetical protein